MKFLLAAIAVLALAPQFAQACAYKANLTGSTLTIYADGSSQVVTTCRNAVQTHVRDQKWNGEAVVGRWEYSCENGIKASWVNFQGRLPSEGKISIYYHDINNLDSYYACDAR